MSGINLLIPSRGRPQDAQAAANSAFDNATLADTVVAIVVDNDDPKYEDYLGLEVDEVFVAKPTGRRGIVDPLNQAALAVISDKDEHGHLPSYIGFMGDDHRVRTKGWDGRLADCHETIVYGNDLFQGENLPTAVFMDARAIRRLGYMAPPSLQHLYVDNFWRDLGKQLNSIRYLPDVVIEHLHPDIIGADGKPKGTYDALKTALNDRHFYDEEYTRYEKFFEREMEEAIEKVRNG